MTRQRMRTSAALPPAPSRGFTLVELMIVVSLIILVLSIALPTMVGLFRAGADAQAANLTAAYLTGARGLAVRDATYAGVKVQIGAGPIAEGACYIAIVQQRDGNAFGVADGYAPLRLPGGMCLGLVDDDTVNGSAFDSAAVANPDVFCSFTVLFSPSGKVVRLVDPTTANPTGNIVYRGNDALFNQQDPNDTWIWDINVANTTAGTGKPGATAMTLFDYGVYQAQADDAAKAAYLNQNGQFLPVNVHTGQLFPRKQQ